MDRLDVPLEQGESSSALVLTGMVLDPQPTNQPTIPPLALQYDNTFALMSMHSQSGAIIEEHNYLPIMGIM